MFVSVFSIKTINNLYIYNYLFVQFAKASEKEKV